MDKFIEKGQYFKILPLFYYQKIYNYNDTLIYFSMRKLLATIMAFVTGSISILVEILPQIAEATLVVN